MVPTFWKLLKMGIYSCFKHTCGDHCQYPKAPQIPYGQTGWSKWMCNLQKHLSINAQFTDYGNFCQLWNFHDLALCLDVSVNTRRPQHFPLLGQHVLLKASHFLQLQFQKVEGQLLLSCYNCSASTWYTSSIHLPHRVLQTPTWKQIRQACLISVITSRTKKGHFRDGGHITLNFRTTFTSVQTLIKFCKTRAKLAVQLCLSLGNE